MPRFTLRLVSAAAALAAASAAQSAADAAQDAADDAQADADTAITNASTADGKAVAAQSALLAGPGLPLLLAPALVEGDGSEKANNFTLPSGLTPAANRKYRVNGICTVRANGGADDGERVLSIVYTDVILTHDGDDFAVYEEGEATLRSNGSDADPVGTLSGALSTWFANAAAYPNFGAGGGYLQLYSTPVNAKDITIEFDGTIADAGLSTV